MSFHYGMNSPTGCIMGRRGAQEKAALVCNASNHTCISPVMALPLLFLDKVSPHMAECVVLIGGKKGAPSQLSAREEPKPAPAEGFKIWHSHLSMHGWNRYTSDGFPPTVTGLLIVPLENTHGSAVTKTTPDTFKATLTGP